MCGRPAKSFVPGEHRRNLAHGLSPRPRKRRTIYGSADLTGPPDSDLEADAAPVAELLDVPDAKLALLLSTTWRLRGAW